MDGWMFWPVDLFKWFSVNSKKVTLSFLWQNDASVTYVYYDVKMTVLKQTVAAFLNWPWYLNGILMCFCYLKASSCSFPFEVSIHILCPFSMHGGVLTIIYSPKIQVRGPTRSLICSSDNQSHMKHFKVGAVTESLCMWAQGINVQIRRD